MLVVIATHLSCGFDRVVSEVKKPRLLEFVATPLVRFTPTNPTRFPDVWSEQTYWVRLRLFGLVPFGRQAIVISMPPTRNGFALRDSGHSALIRTWDHLITIEPHADGVIYRDRVEVKAGLLTPIIWIFAQLLYRHRQSRWRLLVARGFDYDD